MFARSHELLCNYFTGYNFHICKGTYNTRTPWRITTRNVFENNPPPRETGVTNLYEN